MNSQLLREVCALRILYGIDDVGHFDWLCSDLGIGEVARIRSARKREQHYDLLQRLLEHRNDVYLEAGVLVDEEVRVSKKKSLFPGWPRRMESDALQFSEAVLVESDYFLTNDKRFASRANRTGSTCTAVAPSEVPFVSSHLSSELGKDWELELSRFLSLGE